MSTETGMQSTGNRIGSPKSSSTPSSPPSSGGIELPFQPNEPVGHQSSPHSYRHSRAYRHFKNPPQPHMCIRVTTVNGEELFINVLSWTRIVIPQEPSDPIPLYGGMRVPPGSPRSPPLVYAVMANPEVLKDSGRHSKDPEERGAMVELMCDFVEAMNPDIKLTRNAVILKDRDISGELKDVWNAVQAQRDREREEQLTQQQQQHHYHNMQPQQIYLPKAAPQYPQQQTQQLLHNQQQQFNSQAHNNNSNLTTIDNKILYTETGKTEQQAINSSIIEHLNDSSQGNHDNVFQDKNLKSESAINNTEAINMNGASGKDKSPTSSNNCIKNVDTNAKDVTDSTRLTSFVSGAQSINNITNNQVNSLQQQQLQVSNNLQQLNLGSSTGLQQQQQVSPTASVPTVITAANTTAINSTTVTTTTKTATTNNSTIPITTVTPTTTTTTSSTPTTTNTTTTTTKKEKLGGFLPNGCHSIFPRFKNNKHKDKEKDKDKDKESKSNNHSKEKTLLNSFKKSTTAAANAFNNTKSQQQQQQNDDNSKSQYEKNCLNLENEVEKLDLNKIDSPANEVLIKLKVASSGAK